jgi:two-component system, OmpR family, sensor histidine kinase KdpD
LQIASLIEESIAELVQELGNHPVIIHPHARQKAFWADRQLLKMAFCRLFDNAAKYSPPGTAINIDISEQEAEILIAVANQGSFIPQQEWDKIFQRFYRTPGSTGHGHRPLCRQTSHRGSSRACLGKQRPRSRNHFFLALPRTANQES